MLSRARIVLELGCKSLLLHKLRSGLAMLGILIGVMAVIWLVALGEGVSHQAQEQIKELGATNILVKSVKPTQGVSTGRGSTSVVEYGLTELDYDRIVQGVPTIQRAVRMREIPSVARARGREAEVKLLGCSPEYLEINHLKMARGRFLTDRDLKERANVAILASGTSEKLFPYENPIGRTIDIVANSRSDAYIVVGETESRMPSASIGGSLEGRDYNLDVYIPLDTLRARIGDQVVTARSGSQEGEVVQYSQITATVRDIDQVEEAADIIEVLLEKKHPDGDFSITVPKELLRQADMLRMMFNVLLVLIAGISLVVGGIGIMNIMLAVVTERTREIGVRRALGAKRRDILQQFLAETVVLSAIGGVVGVAVGFLCRPVTKGMLAAVERWVPDVWAALPPAVQGLHPIIAPWSIAAAFGISVSVGVVFGLYPARRAALMDPIEALRHE
ncbi:MAG: ABC transporter permease [Planctomycetes bacterium]|nr:ABC transporter permease [Planctomycetota bacterium]